MSISWTISVNSAEGTAKFQTSAAGSTDLDLTQVYEGDYVNITGDLFNEGNKGSFTIVGASVYIDPSSGNLIQYFEIANEDAVAQTVTAEEEHVMFFRPSRASIHLGEARSIMLAQTEPGVVDIVLPATAQAVGRATLIAAYAQNESVAQPIAVTRDRNGAVTMTFEEDPELEVGQHIYLDGVYPATGFPAVTAGDGETTTDAAVQAHISTLKDTTVARKGHTVSLLNSGNVLVAGGNNGTTQLATMVGFNILDETTANSREQYEYEWETLTSMDFARERHQATVLTHSSALGHALMSGGQNGTYGILAASELYNPDSDTVSTLFAVYPRALHTASALDDGRVLLAGGMDSSNTFSKTAELYDPSTETFVATDPMRLARARHKAVTLSDGRVLVVGGRKALDVGPFVSSISPTTNGEGDSVVITGTGLGSAAVTLNALACTVTVNTSTSITIEIPVGAASGSFAITTADGTTYTPVWTLDTDPDQYAGSGTAGTTALTLDGSNSVITNTCEIYDPVTGEWSSTGKMAMAREFHELVVLSDDRVLAIGGWGFNPSQSTTAEYLASVEVWDPRSGRWHPSASLTEGRYGHSAVYLPETNRVFVWGGTTDGTNGVTTTQLWNPDSGNWENCPATLPAEAWHAGSCALIHDDVSNDVAFMYGGEDGTTASAAYLFVFGELVSGSGRINGEWKVTAISDDVDGFYVTFQTPQNAQYAVAHEDSLENVRIDTITRNTSAIPGPYIFDPTEGPAVTAIESTITADLAEGRQYRSLTLASGGALDFPDEEGYLALAFGTADAVYPIKYLGRYSDSELILDYTFRMPNDVPAGSTVTWLAQKGPFEPENPEDIGSFYVTASASGRVAASDAIDMIVAAGIEVNKTVRYPGDRGLGGEGLPATGTKISDKVAVWGGDDLDTELAEAREEDE